MGKHKIVKKEISEKDNSKIEEIGFFKRFKNSFYIIKENKLLFSALTILMVAYLSAFVFLYNLFISKFYEYGKDILDYIDLLAMNANSLSQNNLEFLNQGPDPMKIYQAEITLLKITLLFVVIGLISLLLFEGISWLIITIMRKKISVKTYLKNFFTIHLVYVPLFFLFFAFSLNKSFEYALNGEPNLALNIITTIIFLVIIYFYFISLALTTSVTTLKELFFKTFKLSIKLTITTPTYFISLVLILIFFSLIYIQFLVYEFIWTGIISIIALFIVLAYIRILLTSMFE